MNDLNQRPTIANKTLAAVTNTLARWLPGGEGTPALSDVETAVAQWTQPEWEAALWVVYWQNALPWLANRVAESGMMLPEG
jgi:hypothetical protein